MVKRLVNADDVLGTGIAKYVHDVAWWSQASGQPPASVEVFWKGPPSHGFEKVEITFHNDDSAANFEYRMETYGVRVLRVE